MGLAGFPNTSAAPQQGQFHAAGLGAAGAAGLAAQQVRYCSSRVRGVSSMTVFLLQDTVYNLMGLLMVDR